MTHPTDDGLKPCPFCGSQPEPAPYVLKCVNAYCEAQPSVSGGNDDECATAWNKRALLAEQARTEPHKAEDAPSDDELKDLAHSAYEEALSFGLSVDTFLRYFKGICKRAAIAQERKA